MRSLMPILSVLALLAVGCNRSNDAAVKRSAVTPPSADEPKSSQKSVDSNATVARTADGTTADEPKTSADEPKTRLNAKPNAKLKMEQALARHDQIDRQIKSIQNNRRLQVSPELLRQRDEAWKAYLEACKVYNDLP